MDVKLGIHKRMVEHKINNYIKKYASRNQLMIAEACTQFFSKTHERFGSKLLRRNYLNI